LESALDDSCRQALVLTIAIPGIYLSFATSTLPQPLILVIARSLAGWSAWHCSPTHPRLAAGVGASNGRLLMLLYWETGPDGGHAWWEFSARAHDDLPGVLISGVLVECGACAYGLTPWRLQRLRRIVFLSGHEQVCLIEESATAKSPQ
jgi:hypothetical protein